MAGRVRAPSRAAIRSAPGQGRAGGARHRRRSVSISGCSEPRSRSSTAFFGLPWITGLIGAATCRARPSIRPAPPACAASQRRRRASRRATRACALVITADRPRTARTSTILIPRARAAPAQHEDWVLDNFSTTRWPGRDDPDRRECRARNSRSAPPSKTTSTLRRYAQYQDALADNCAFLRALHDLAVRCARSPASRRPRRSSQGDQGIHPTSADKICALEAGAVGRHRHLCWPDPSGRRQRGDGA